MKRLTIILITCAFLFGCSSNEENVNSADSVDTIAGQRNVSCIYEPPASHVWCKEQVLQLCELPPHRVITHDDIKRNGMRKPYNYQKEENKDSLILSFEFIDDCCLKYTADTYQSQDSLFLGYYLPNDSNKVCDCWCDYRMTYRIKKDSVAWKTISIVDGPAMRTIEFFSFPE